jgi:hypothetical protein
VEEQVVDPVLAEEWKGETLAKQPSSAKLPRTSRRYNVSDIMLLVVIMALAFVLDL